MSESVIEFGHHPLVFCERTKLFLVPYAKAHDRETRIVVHGHVDVMNHFQRIHRVDIGYIVSSRLGMKDNLAKDAVEVITKLKEFNQSAGDERKIKDVLARLQNQ